MTAEAVTTAIQKARKAQSAWSISAWEVRQFFFRQLRHTIADASDWPQQLAQYRQVGEAEALASEILPLADTCQWLENQAKSILKPRKVSAKHRPKWLGGTHLTETWQARGLVLIIGPGNYPLFLTLAPALQALAAGNTVCIKPAPGTKALIEKFLELCHQAGLPDGLVCCLDSEVASVYRALETGVDLAVFTGSSTHGRQLLQSCAERLTPAIVELSGCDAVFVLDDADLDLAADSIAYGLGLNHGRTCISPRRILVAASVHSAFAEKLKCAIELRREICPITPPPLLETVIADAAAQGARQLTGSTDPLTPILLDRITPTSLLWRSDLFAPICGVYPFADLEDALAAERQCPYRLGVSLFTANTQAAIPLARHLRIPNVVINDLIVPTADPRMAFGGAGESGWGVTRGAEGLRQMALPQRIVVRKTRFRPYLDPEQATQAGVLSALLKLLHGNTGKWKALTELIRASKLKSGR